MKILIIEDEFNLADAIREALVGYNYEVSIATDGLEGYYKASDMVYDLIILDVMLPRMDGFEILKKLREDKVLSKIIMLTAKGGLEDKLKGLENGANDYVTKPFHIEELIARVNIWLNKNDKFVIRYGDLELNQTNSTLKSLKSNEKVSLVKKELEILEYFISNSNQILSKEQIYDRVWGFDNVVESNNLEAYLSFIRRKLKAIETDVNIKSVRGIGYIMEVRDEGVKK